jgi:RIO kinase 1
MLPASAPGTAATACARTKPKVDSSAGRRSSARVTSSSASTCRGSKTGAADVRDTIRVSSPRSPCFDRAHRPSPRALRPWRAERRRPRRFPIPPKIDPDDWHADVEPPKRKKRRTPKGRQNVTTLLDAEGHAAPGTALARLQERGYVQEILGELKSGKEGTVYLGRSPVGPAAVKIYRDAEVRSFKNDQRYLEGRWVGDARLAKAIKRRSGAGRLALKAMWAAQEYLVLWKAWNAGLPVPEPLVGPDQSDIADAGEVVLMRFVGDPDAPAPRLSDAVLEPEEAADAFAQSVAAMRGLWRIGLVHGDYSTYNLLWWAGRVTVIDLPQAMSTDQPNARDVLAQDAGSLVQTFARLGVEADADEVVRQVTADA